MVGAPILSFRFKILLLVVAILGGVISSSMFVTQRRIEATYDKLFARQYETQIEYFNSRQRMMLADVMTQCQELAIDEEFVAAVESVDLEILRRISGQQFEGHFSGDTTWSSSRGRSGAAGSGQVKEAVDGARTKIQRFSKPLLKSPYFKIYDSKGDELLGIGNSSRAVKLPQRTLDYYNNLLAEAETQQIGYFRGHGEDGFDYVVSVMVTPVHSTTTGQFLGVIVMGLQIVDFGGLNRSAPVQSGIVLDGDLFSFTIPLTLRSRLLESLSTVMEGDSEKATSFDIELNDEPYMCFVKALNPGSVFPVALNVSLYSLADQEQDLRVMRLRVLAFGAIVFVIGGIFAWLISLRLVVPLNELVVGTKEIEQGNYQYNVRVRSRDEVGQLALSFNEMAEGLALKEKFQTVLNQVADREVADELMNGRLALGGVMTSATVLFCDIRGFSRMTQKLSPSEVVRFLNEHMTAMTENAHEFRGVVDKFVGDMIMVVFGAPKSYGKDAENAVRCALKMIETRNALNSKLTDRIEIGIGIATGQMLAGCMGSDDRLNYTVLGEKVNLGSRLCDTAGRMDILMDEETHRVLDDELLDVEALDGIPLKGFKDPMKAFRVIKLRAG